MRKVESLEEAKAIFARIKPPLSEKGLSLLGVAFDIAEGKLDVHDGDLRSRKPLSLKAPLVVDGDLDVDGWLEDQVGLDHNVVFVTGDLRCRGYIGEAVMVVLGSLHCKGDLWLMSHGDNTLYIRGDLRGGIIASGGHWLNLPGKLSVKAVVGGLQPAGKTQWKPAYQHQVLHPELFSLDVSKSEMKEMEADDIDDCCELKEKKIISWIKKGRSLGKK